VIRDPVPNNMRQEFKFFRLLALVLLLASISGCSVPLDVVFHNASGSDVLVTRKNEKHEVVRLTIKDKSTEVIRGLLSAKFTIGRESETERYASEYVDESFVEYVGLWPSYKRKTKAQLEADGCIYLVPVKDDFSSRPHATQPEGFPLCPES
jgi:hypothetical protein